MLHHVHTITALVKKSPEMILCMVAYLHTVLWLYQKVSHMLAWLEYDIQFQMRMAALDNRPWKCGSMFPASQDLHIHVVPGRTHLTYHNGMSTRHRGKHWTYVYTSRLGQANCIDTSV